MKKVSPDRSFPRRPPSWFPGRALLAAALAIACWVWPGAVVGGVAAAAPLSYLALPPVERWDVDVSYRFDRRDQEAASIAAGYEWQDRQEVHELALSIRARLGPRQLAVLRLPLTYAKGDGRGWRVGPAGWEPAARRDRLLALRPVSAGWRREASWFAEDDTEWGADAVFGGGAGWALVPRLRWLWLRDPVVLGTELALPWRFSPSVPGGAASVRARVVLDHAVNHRLVVSGGVAWEGEGLVSLWGWSIRAAPGRYWSVQVEVPAAGRGFSLHSGWRFRL